MSKWSSILEADLHWREAELASLKRIAITNSSNEITYRAVLRASWAMLYAHFEGFTKFCWDLLLDEVQGKRVPVSQLEDGFRMIALEKSLKSFKRDVSSTAIWNYFTIELPAILDAEAVFHADCRLDPESNLWPNVFERECSKIGVTSNAIQEQRAHIKSLVSRRNDIAHGKTMTIKSVSEYADYEKAVFLVLDDLATETLRILRTESYIKGR